LIKVMNLVALLAASSIVTAVDAGNTALRIAVAVVGLAILIGAFYISARREEADFGGETEPATAPEVAA
jgi:hypothetical protein